MLRPPPGTSRGCHHEIDADRARGVVNARGAIRAVRSACSRGRSSFAVAATMLVALGCADARGDERVTLRFWALGREGEVVQQMLPAFEREHPRVKVEVQQIPFTAAHEKLLTAFVGEATPDVAMIGNTWIPEFHALRGLVRLDTFPTREARREGYFPGIWDTNVMDGALYGVPWYVDTRLIFYRTDLLARAGYATMPRTWGEWREAMRKITAQGGGAATRHWAIYLPLNEWNVQVILGLQAGSPLLKDGGTYGAFEDSAFRRGFDFYTGLFRDGLAPALRINEVSNIYQEIARGTFAMWITGPWNIGEFSRRMPPEMRERWGTAPMPGPDGDSTAISLAGGSSLAIFRNTRHAAEAWQLIEFLSRVDQQVRFYRLTGDLPARTEAWRAARLADDRYARAFYEQLQRVRATPKVPEWEQIASKVQDYTELAVRGGVSEARALAALDRDVNDLLEKRRWMAARSAAR
jgi:multiple sugar transport system substrate-binding protein